MSDPAHKPVKEGLTLDHVIIGGVRGESPVNDIRTMVVAPRIQLGIVDAGTFAVWFDLTGNGDCRRAGLSFRMDDPKIGGYIRRILQVCGVENWTDIVGQEVRAWFDHHGRFIGLASRDDDRVMNWEFEGTHDR